MDYTPQTLENFLFNFKYESTRVVENLTITDIHNMKCVSKNMLSLMTSDFMNNIKLQKKINQLNFLGANITTPVTDNNILLAIDQGFKRVDNRQQEEAQHIKSKHFHVIIQILDIVNIIGSPALNIKTLDERDGMLHRFNCQYIFKEINDNRNSKTLNLASKCITRFPNALLKNPALKNYWENVEIIDVNFNKLINLPDLNLCPNLKQLRCTANLLTTLPTFESCANFEKLYCAENYLTNLPENLKSKGFKLKKQKTTTPILLTPALNQATLNNGEQQKAEILSLTLRNQKP